MKGYHFTGDKLRDGRPIPPIGEWLVHDGPVVPCESGLHMSEHPLDALYNAPGSTLHAVELEGDLMSHGDPQGPIDKWVGRRRRIIATIDATSMLREFARWCALQVIDLWDAPAVVREYLETGDDSLRAAARAAAAGAAWAASSRAAAGAAAWAAAWAASSRAAARAAAWAAAWAASSRAAAWAARAAQRTQFLDMVEAHFAAQRRGGGDDADNG